MTTKIVIAGRMVSRGPLCFVIAEAGSNCNGLLSQTKELIMGLITQSLGACSNV